MSSELIPRDTLKTIVEHRDRALELYREAFKAIRRASEAVELAEAQVTQACGSFGEDYWSFVDRHKPEIESFVQAVKLPDESDYRETALRLTDLRVWAAVIERTEIETLMDKEERDKLRQTMSMREESRRGHSLEPSGNAEGLPLVTVDNVVATLERLAADAPTIFRRGLANAFSNLDRRFRTHDGFAIGSRIILDGAFDQWGMWSHWRGHRDTLKDVERVFLRLDGKPPAATYASIVGAIDAHRKSDGAGLSPRQSVVEGDYFRVRIFRNGNAHLWFTRKDLVIEANKLLAEYYGAQLRDPSGQTEANPLTNRAVGHARNLGYFPTPDHLADRVIECAHITKGLRTLEPSAGDGALARRAAACGALVDTIELEPMRARALLESRLYRRVECADFLHVTSAPIYDRILMNPPFDRGRDIDHVAHAWEFLKPGGRLVAIMSAGTEFREDKKARAFRALMEQNQAQWSDLPAVSFAPATNVNTLLLSVKKPDC